MLARRWILAASLPLVLAASGVAGAAAAPASHHARPGSTAALRRAMAELARMPGGPPGVAVVVQRGRVRHFYHAGVAVIGGRAPRITDHMRIASVSKALNGAVALALVDRGVLHLRDTIGHWLPGLPKRWHRVTLREMLLHTSGLPNFTASPKYTDAIQASPKHPPLPRGLVRFVAHSPLEFPPGTKYDYSNTDNLVVALMSRKATGRSYFHEMQRAVLRPLHLQQTSLPHNAAMPRPYIHGYGLDEKTNRPTDDITHLVGGGWFWSSGGAVSTPGNLNRFIRGYVSGRLLSRHLRRMWHRMFIPASGSEPAGPGFESVGLGVFRYATRCGTVYGHTGNVFGYTQFALSTLNGSRSATVSINVQVNQQNIGQKARVFSALTRVVQRAVCSATG